MDKLRTQPVGVAVGVASAVGIEAAVGRFAVIFFPPVAGRYSVNFGGQAVLDSGITMIAGMSPYSVTRDDIGDDILAGASFIASAPLTAPVLVVNGLCCRREYE